MKDLSGESFDRIMSKLKTTQLTSNTEKVTELIDDFEPRNKGTLGLASLIP